MDSTVLNPDFEKRWSAGSHSWVLKQGRPLVMGIVNVTPDSFSDGGSFSNWQSAVDHGLQLVQEGADILDIGGESTRPGSAPVDAKQEWERVGQVIQALAKHGIALSVDTMKTRIMEQALDAGAVIWNDVNAFRDTGALDLLARCDAGAVVMHMQGQPKTMQVAPEYVQVVNEVYDFLAARIESMNEAGVQGDRILVDPGFGFGKTLEHNQALFGSLRRLADLGAGVLVGVSRKRMIGEITGVEDPQRRVAGSVAAAMLAAQRGAAVVRVHDVKATVDALKVLSWAGD